MVIPRRVRVGQVVRKSVGDTSAADLLMQIAEELKMSKAEGPKQAFTHEASLKMNQPLNLVPMFQCDARGVPKAGNAQPLTQKAINHWQASAKDVVPDYRETFGFLFGRRLPNGASVVSSFDQAE